MSDVPVVQVGDSILSRAPLNTEHPLYRSVALGAEQKLREIANREDVRQRGKRRVLGFDSLTADEAKVVAGLFPEFSLVDYGMNMPGHALVSVILQLSNEWCVTQAVRYSDKLVHVGGRPLEHVLGGRNNVHLCGDFTDDLFIHQLHENTLSLVRCARECADISKLLGVEVPVARISEVLASKSMSYCHQGARCEHQVDIAVVNGFNCVMGPKQVAAGMAQTGARMAYGFFPFTPGMLVSNEGFLGNTDIYYEKRDIGGIDVFNFVQSKGRVMVPAYPVILWAQWTQNHVVRVRWKGKPKYYKFELLINRSCVMFYRMVELNGVPERNIIMHAFDLPMYKDMYMISSWRLRGITLDLEEPKSWESVAFVAEKRLVDRVYAFGMQLNQKDFTRFAIRKQLKITNDRVVVSGTSVAWHAPLTPDQIDALSIALFARLFVDRYEAGNLSKELMDKLAKLIGFSQGTLYGRIRIVAGLCLSGLWENTLGRIDEAVRRLCDRIIKYGSRKRVGPKIAIEIAPRYVEVTSVTITWLQKIADKIGFDFYSWPPGFDPNLIGYETAIVNSQDVNPGKPELFGITTDLLVPGNKLVMQVENGENAFPQDPFKTEQKERTLSSLGKLNELDYEGVDRLHNYAVVAKRVLPTIPAKPDFDFDPDPVETLNEVYRAIFPGNTLVDSRYDVASNVFDPQDRNFSARYLKMGHTSDAPKPQRVYASRIRALNVPKRQETLAELISATSARNLDPPVVSKPQSYETMIPEVWEVFKRKACRPDVEELLAKFRDDPVAMGEGAFQDWMSKVKNEGVITRVAKQMEEHAMSVEEYDVGSYVAMNKADVKVPLSDKTQFERIEPQVIVYHDKLLSACYSAIFRIMVSRFLAILAPNVHINLRKDSRDIAAFINALHPYDLEDAGEKPIYLENDFSKYDKSQLEIVFTFEKFVFEQLGMNQEFVDKWFLGHIDCKIRSFLHSFTLHVAWQRKSGDATTAFGNVILNAASVLYSYPMSDIYWMVFMGDDSIVCTKQASAYDKAVKILAEVFNLQAKTYITEAPYFASNFVVVNQAERTTALLPDPIKRIERWSMDVSTLDDTWEEKFISAADVCYFYRYKMYTTPLSKLVIQRYPNIDLRSAELMCNAISNLTSSFEKFRSMAETENSLILY